MVKKILKIPFKILTWIVMLAIVLFAVAMVGVRLFGVQVYTVLSGSMDPVYKTGSVIYVVDVDPAELQEGDDITFKLSEETTATHRIIEVITDESDPSVLQFRTQGVANDVEDASPVDASDVIGTPVFTIPYLGYVASYIQSPPGIYVGLCVGCAALLFVVIVELVFSDDDEKAEKKKKKSKKNEAEGKNEGSAESVNDKFNID